MLDDCDKIERVLNHIELVRMNCIKLGEKLIELGEKLEGRQLIANGLVHDTSKLSGIEFEYLFPEYQETDPQLFAAAHTQHVTSNKHHPEHWGKIHMMGKVYITEMVMDWKARSTEFGTALRDWIDKEATQRFGFHKQEKIYTQIMRFAEMSCEKPFKQVKRLEAIK